MEKVWCDWTRLLCVFSVHYLLPNIYGASIMILSCSLFYIFNSWISMIFVKIGIFYARVPYTFLWLLSAGAKQSRKDSPSHFLLQLWFEWHAVWYQSKILQSGWISDSIDMDIVLIQNAKRKLILISYICYKVLSNIK
jgi:hypothetical protein